MEREEFFRLKKVQEKNKKLKAAEDKKRQELKEQGLLKEIEAPNLLTDQEDTDILFK